MLIGQKYLLDKTIFICIGENRFNEYDENGDLITERNCMGDLKPSVRLIFDRVSELQPIGKQQLTLF